MKLENLKTYVSSNTFKSGKGPTAWRSSTLTARSEVYGAAQVGIADQTAKDEALKEETAGEDEVKVEAVPEEKGIAPVPETESVYKD